MIKWLIGIIVAFGLVNLAFVVVIILFFATLLGTLGSASAGATGTGSGGDGGINPVPGSHKGLVRVEQLNRDEYASDDEWKTWRASTCSAASLTAALRTLGYSTVKITNVLARLGSNITVDEGLLDPAALAAVGRSYGIPAESKDLTYEDLKTASANNYLVLIDIRNSTFPAGHWVMLSSTDDIGTQVTDPWPTNIPSFTKAQLESYWHSRGVVISTKYN